MTGAHPFVSLSIWLAVAAWAAVMAGRCRGREIPGALPIWIAGFVAYLAHVFAAFAIHHQWSHALALAETARQTGDLTGFESGSGLWLNYLFGLLWLIDALRWLVTGDPRPAGRWRPVFAAIHAFLAFMILNGTIVFGPPAARWFGLAIFALLATVWLRAKLRPQPVL